MTDKLSHSEINNFDRYIEQLLQCKHLSEVEVKNLCDKVIFPLYKELKITIGKRNSVRGIQCATCKMPSYYLR